MGNGEPRAKTADECRDEFLGYLQCLVSNVARGPEDVTEKLNLLVFSILNVFDGTAGGCLTLDLVTVANPEDVEYYRENGENWTPIGVNIAAGREHLHELWAKRYWRK